MKKLFFFIACLLAFDVTNLQLHIVKKTHIDWLILISLVFSIFLTGYAWYYCHKERAGKPMQNAVRQLALGLLIGAGTVIPIIAFFAVTNYIRFLPKNLTLMLFIYALIFSSGAAVFEEIAFRGFLQGCLRYFFQKPLFAPIVILPVVMAFTYGHMGIYSDIFHAHLGAVALAGLVLGIMAYKTQALWLSMGTHFAWDFFTIMAFGYDQRRFEKQIGVLDSLQNFSPYAFYGLFIAISTYLAFKIIQYSKIRYCLRGGESKAGKTFEFN